MRAAALPPRFQLGTGRRVPDGGRAVVSQDVEARDRFVEVTLEDAPAPSIGESCHAVVQLVQDDGCGTDRPPSLHC
jgi:hypothetical protein